MCGPFIISRPIALLTLEIIFSFLSTASSRATDAYESAMANFSMACRKNIRFQRRIFCGAA